MIASFIIPSFKLEHIYLGIEKKREALKCFLAKIIKSQFSSWSEGPSTLISPVLVDNSKERSAFPLL